MRTRHSNKKEKDLLLNLKAKQRRKTCLYSTLERRRNLSYLLSVIFHNLNKISLTKIFPIYRIKSTLSSFESGANYQGISRKLGFANFAEKRAVLGARRALNYYYLYSPEESTPAGKAESRFLERDRDTVTMELCKSSDYSSLQIGNRGCDTVSSSKETFLSNFIE